MHPSKPEEKREEQKRAGEGIKRQRGIQGKGLAELRGVVL